ncbi:hypothetical protein [Streptomyces sp. PA03-2a]|uniref:hypothetical protein n=1 Tax=Streptomyces sp. PA03-2a TaxID=3028701 RepID=UPI0029BF9A52|nr:hypothetical protein [Streptomyces sp. PA03-2a]MDX2732828.1 hypothetical protein [Streptomyces sp. PA03-2a]
MSLHLGIRRSSRPKHRASDKVTAQQDQIRQLGEKLAAADSMIRDLIAEKSDANRARRAAEEKHRFVGDVVAVRDRQIRDLKARIRDLEENRGNGPEAPAPTATRFDTGRVIRHGAHTPTWVPVGDSETTQTIPIQQLPQPAAA